MADQASGSQSGLCVKIQNIEDEIRGCTRSSGGQRMFFYLIQNAMGVSQHHVIQSSSNQYTALLLTPACCTALPHSSSTTNDDGKAFQRYSKRSSQSQPSMQQSGQSHMTDASNPQQPPQQQEQPDLSASESDLQQMQSAFASMSDDDKRRFLQLGIQELDAAQVRQENGLSLQILTAAPSVYTATVAVKSNEPGSMVWRSDDQLLSGPRVPRSTPKKDPLVLFQA